MSKRLFDLTLALVSLALIWPILLVVAILIRIDSPGPAIFRQTRLGKNGRHFRIYKLRTMYWTADQCSHNLTLNDDPRITPVGKFLRRYKLDELAQLLNVVKGEMSIVGPRPDVPQYYDPNDPRVLKVLSLKPGLTSPASIKYSLLPGANEANALTAALDPEQHYRQQIFNDKMTLNLQYIEQRTFLGDIKIIGQTLYYLLKQIIRH